MFELIYRCDPARPRDRDIPADPRAVQTCLEEGNDAFATMATAAMEGQRVVHFDLEDLGISLEGRPPRQQAFAVVLGCSDARVPVELIFDRACNELFVVRVAGNILGQEQLGSIDYAVENLEHVKLLVVLGHSRCGAVTAAVDAFLHTEDYLGLLSSHHVRAIVNALFPAVRGSQSALAEVWGPGVIQMPGYRTALIECAVVLNAALTSTVLRQEFCRDSDRRKAVYGVYDLGSRRVQVPRKDVDLSASPTRLVEAPEDLAAFRSLSIQVASGPLIQRLLGS